MINVAPTIDRFASDYTVRRPGATTYVAGFPQQASATTRTVRAMVRPATGRDLERLPEGDRANETKRIWATSELFGVDVQGGRAADVFEIDGDDWELRVVWTSQPQGNYWSALAQRVGQ